MKINNCLSVFIAAAVFFTSGCSVSYGNKLIKRESVISNAKQEITKDYMTSKLGYPDNVFKQDGTEVYEYRHIKLNGNYPLLFPVLGWIAGFFVSDILYKANYLYCYFDENGKLINHKRVKYGGGYPPSMPDFKYNK